MNNNTLGNELSARSLSLANNQPPEDPAKESESQLEMWMGLIDLWNFNGPVLIY